MKQKLTEKEEGHTTARSSLEDLARKWQKCATHRENAVGTFISRDLIIMKARAPCSLTTATYHGTVITTYLPALLRFPSLPPLPLLLFSYSIFTVITVSQMCQRFFLRFSSQHLIIRSTNTRIRYSRRGLILHSNESPLTDYTWISFFTEYNCKFWHV